MSELAAWIIDHVSELFKQFVCSIEYLHQCETALIAVTDLLLTVFLHEVFYCKQMN